MKATSTAVVKEDGLHFPLKRKNYDDLRVHRAVPLILVIVELPATDSRWIDFHKKRVTLRRRAWWASLRGQDAITGSQKTIIVPRSQVLNVNVLIDLMVRTREGKL